MDKAKHAILALVMVAGASISAQQAIGQAKPSIKNDEGPFGQLLKCRIMPDVVKKAACYDDATDALEADRAANKIAIVTGTQIEGLQRDAFGFNMPSLPRLQFGRNNSALDKNAPSEMPGSDGGKILKKSKSGEVLRVSYEVKRVSTLSNGHKKIYLSNGQVWEQVSSEPPRFRGSGPYKVEIIKAAFGSYLLVVKGSKRSTRVRRVQ